MITGAPDPVAPFSHAVEQDSWVFVTGQTPFSGTANDSPYSEDIEVQTHRVMDNLLRVLAGCGLSLANVLQCRVYLLHFDRDFAAMSAACASYFALGRRLARTCVGVSGLARGGLIEIDLVARRPAPVAPGLPAAA